MAVTRAKKVELVQEWNVEFQQAGAAILGTFSGLKAAQAEELRKTVREAGANYKVIKNTLAARAAEGTRVGEVLTGLKGVTSIAYTKDDPVALAKALAKYAKGNPEYAFKAGIVEGRVISIQEVEALATMPSKDEIYSKLLFLINAPAQRLATVVNATGRDLAVVLNQGVKENKFAGGGEAAAGS
jgi:large subunit ribosomal protein L10